MRLIYLWIDSYQHIKSKGFLLDSGYDVQYDKECNELTVRRKENLDSLLYGPKISVTAIVGDNAAGKSTVLDAVRTVLFDQYSREDNFRHKGSGTVKRK